MALPNEQEFYGHRVFFHLPMVSLLVMRWKKLRTLMKVLKYSSNTFFSSETSTWLRIHKNCSKTGVGILHFLPPSLNRLKSSFLFKDCELWFPSTFVQPPEDVEFMKPSFDSFNYTFQITMSLINSLWRFPVWFILVSFSS